MNLSLLNVQYLFILGRKNTSVSLRICFDKKDCFHLMGLQYLTDRPKLSRDRGKIFDEIKNRKITITQIESSYFYSIVAFHNCNNRYNHQWGIPQMHFLPFPDWVYKCHTQKYQIGIYRK